MDEKKDLIEKIKSAYLAKKDMEDAYIKSMWSQYQKMAKELSEGIYAEDNHFIYELIQNAEDTESREEKHVIEFTLVDEGLIVFNNEIGFTEEQIKAICAFGESTKSSDKNKGYIGEKGIGFKSVFKITDKPAIYSNGYRFYFRRLDNSGNTEYIIPHWISDKELNTYPDKFRQNTHTTLFLPFDKSKKEERLNKLRKDIRQIEPILLLFLNRLDSIRIYDKEKEVVSTEKSIYKSENLRVVRIKNKEHKDKYFVFKKEIKVDPNLDEVRDQKNGRRQNVKHREIILAFPDTKNKTKEDRIFAFLPTNLHSRLEFVIQADFILQSGRENIAIDSEWNQWQLEEIKDFLANEIIFEFQKHSKLRFEYLRYFLRNGESDNELINSMYSELLKKLQEEKIILGHNEKWHKPENILILEKGLKLDSRYLKMLYGDRYEQKHSSFLFPEELIETFNVRVVSRQGLIARIADFFSREPINSLDQEVVYDLTVFLSKHSIVDSRSPKFDKELFMKIKKVLPIIPKYQMRSKFYYADSIYLSEEYSPDFDLEDLIDLQSCQFETFNFLSPAYFHREEKGVEKFLRKVLEEQKEDNNKKTLDFFSTSAYAEYLQAYLLKNKSRHYEKVFQFLIENKRDNIDRIKAIPLILTENGRFFSAKDQGQVFFPTANADESLNILDDELFELIRSNKEFKDLLQDIFGVKEADIHNTIISQYIPWFKKNRTNRSDDNDKLALKYTELIIKHFDELDSDDKKLIREAMCFVATNNSEKYLRAGDVYLPKNIADILAKDSIEEYVKDTAFFNFLGKEYYAILANQKENDIKIFFEHFNFKTKRLVSGDLHKFITYYSDTLTLDKSVEAFKIIVESDDFQENRNVPMKLKEVRLYSHDEELMPIKSLFLNQVSELDLPYLHPKYHEKINFSLYKTIRKYFQSPYTLEPFIHKLKGCNDPKIATNIYQYLHRHSQFDISRNQPAIPPVKIKKAFEKDALIISDEGAKLYPYQAVWIQQKSGTDLFALSSIYPSELQDFFIKTVQVSQHRSIKQIVDQIKDIKSRDKKKTSLYFALLVDLSQMISSREELENYRNDYNGSIDGAKLSTNVIENAKLFLGQKENIFITDANTFKSSDLVIFNDLDIDVPEKAKSVVLTLEDYGKDAFSGLIKELQIKTFSGLPKVYEYQDKGRLYPIEDYRRILHFAYDYIFSKYHEYYRKLADYEDELEKINSVDVVRVVKKIESKIEIENITIPIENQKFFFNPNQKELVVSEEKSIGKALSSILQNISDKDITHFIEKVIDDKEDIDDYYREEDVKEKKNFPLSISDVIPEVYREEKPRDEISHSQEEVQFIPDLTEHGNRTPMTPEEQQKHNLQTSGKDIVEGYEKDVADGSREIEPVAGGVNESKINDFLERQKKKVEKIRNAIKEQDEIVKKELVNTKNNYRHGDEDTKAFFRLKEQYDGHCQICGFTFRTKENINYCERFTWTDKKRNDIRASVIYPGNSLCLCANCHSIIKNGGDFKARFLQEDNNLKDFEKFLRKYGGKHVENAPEVFQDHIDFNDMYALPIKINNEEKNIYFTEQHLLGDRPTFCVSQISPHSHIEL